MTSATNFGPPAAPDGLTPERLKAIIHRLQTDFYDTPAVRAAIAQRIRVDLES